MLGTIALTWVNYIGIKTAATLNNALTLIIGLGGVLLITGGLFNGETANMAPFFVGGMKGFLGVMIMTPFMFVGFNVIPQAAEEMNLPHKSIGKILIVSVMMAVFFYMLVILAVSASLAPNEMNLDSLVTADAMSKVFGGAWAGKALIMAGLAGIITSWIGFYVGGSRAIYAMAKANILPEFLGKIHPKYQTPCNAVLLIGIATFFAPLFGRKMLVWLVDAGGLGIQIAYFLVCIAFVILRKKEPDMARPFRAGNGSWIGWVAVVLGFLFILAFLPGSPAALVWPNEWLLVGVWYILGAILFFWAKGKYGTEKMDKNMHDHVFGDKHIA